MSEYWAQFDQSFVDAAISQWRRLSPCVRVRGAHSEHKFWQFWIGLLYELIILLNKPHCSLLCANQVVRKFIADSNFQRYVQFGTSAFNTVVWWRQLGEVENECPSHNFSFFAIILPKLMGIWRRSDKNNFAQFFWDTV